MVYNNVVVTVKDGRDIDEVKSLLLEQTRLSRLEPGCERFELYHSQSDAKVFILVERWNSAEALDQHRLAKAYVEIYKPKVLPKVDRTPHSCALLEP
ncbi:MAG: antibiotic biosynthesis monooxygenase [Planctomycetia bacterium]|nr:antibiotic biosynthesis monooxygenase [Planctomycetia bacterium]